MKKFTKLILSVFLSFSIFNFNGINTQADEQKWIRSIDSEGNVVESLDMSESEIEEMQISILKQKYESTRTGGYVYSYKKVKQVYDTGSNITSYILIGSNLGWKQRSQCTFGKNVSFSLTAGYKNITGSASMSMSVEETISFDSSMDSKLGIFGRIKTNQYKVTKTDKYSGKVISSYTENMMLVFDRTYRPIYRKSNNKIIFKYSKSTYQASILKSKLKKAPTKKSDFENATNSNF